MEHTYYCKNCKETFDEPEVITAFEDPAVGYWEGDEVCPHCGSLQFAYAHKCEFCKAETYDSDDHLCECCRGQVTNMFKEMVVRFASAYRVPFEHAYEDIAMVVENEILSADKFDGVKELWKSQQE